MLEVYERLGTGVAGVVHERLQLSHDQRQKGRIRATSQQGVEIRIFLERGTPLAVGEVLRSQCGKNILVEGAVETVTEARAADWLTFSKACYHLGNRHVKIQVGEQWLRITPDHVLEEMLVGLGLTVTPCEAVFEPENGAYAKGGTAHSHAAGHSHSHEHEHDHVHHAH